MEMKPYNALLAPARELKLFLTPARQTCVQIPPARYPSGAKNSLPGVSPSSISPISRLVSLTIVFSANSMKMPKPSPAKPSSHPISVQPPPRKVW